MTYRVHALLVHFPVCCWTLAASVELIPPIANALDGMGVAAVPLIQLFIWTGVLFAVPSAIAGALEFVTLPMGTAVERTAKLHALSVGAATVVALLYGLGRTGGSEFDWPPLATKALMLFGLALLLIAGHAGGRIVAERRA